LISTCQLTFHSASPFLSLRRVSRLKTVRLGVNGPDPVPRVAGNARPMNMIPRSRNVSPNSHSTNKNMTFNMCLQLSGICLTRLCIIRHVCVLCSHRVESVNQGYTECGPSLLLSFAYL
jgi:hypothetical protein